METSIGAKAYRAYFLTSNNPQDHYEWAKGFDFDNATQGEYRMLLERSIEPFVKGGNGTDRDPEKNGVLAVVEVGEQGTPHIHHLICSANPIRFSVLQKKYPHSDIEPVRGKESEVTDYIYKRGKFKDKNETQRCEPLTWGDYFSDNKGSQSPSPVFDEIDQLLSQGLRPKDIFELSPKYAFYRSAIESTYAARRSHEIPLQRDLTVFWHYGETGSGKSHVFYDLCRERSRDEIYFVSGRYSNIWDTYAYEPIVFLDEYREECMPYTELLSLLDVYPVTLRCRYADKQAAFTEVHITSIFPPEQMYRFLRSRDSIEQLLRRLSYVVYHYIDSSLTGRDRYRSVTYTGAKYFSSYGEINYM